MNGIHTLFKLYLVKWNLPPSTLYSNRVVKTVCSTPLSLWWLRHGKLALGVHTRAYETWGLWNQKTMLPFDNHSSSVTSMPGIDPGGICLLVPGSWSRCFPVLLLLGMGSAWVPENSRVRITRTCFDQRYQIFLFIHRSARAASEGPASFWFPDLRSVLLLAWVWVLEFGKSAVGLYWTGEVRNGQLMGSLIIFIMAYISL